MTTLERMQVPLGRSNAPLYDWDELVQEDRVHRLIYTDPAVFDAEMTHIFGGTWVYLAHESQIPNPNDFIRGTLGSTTADHHPRFCRHNPRALQSLHASRHDTMPLGQRAILALFNAHIMGGIFLTPANCAGCRGRTATPTNSSSDPKYNLAQVPRVKSYRGFIFGTLNVGAVPIVEHLGPIKKPIDEWLDRNPGGKVTVCEANRFKYKGNWKLAYDNSGDGYHVIYSHHSLLETENRFKDENSEGDVLLQAKT